MIGALRRAWDSFRGSGDAAVTVPPMDGALRPNRLLEEAEVLVSADAPDDIADTGNGLVFSSGSRIVRLGADGRAETGEDCGAEITALAGRTRGLLENPVLPGPDERSRPIPWPAF